MSSRDGVGAGTLSSFGKALNLENRGGRLDLGGPWLLLIPPPGLIPQEPPTGAKSRRSPPLSVLGEGFFMAWLNRDDLFDWAVFQSLAFFWGGWGRRD